MLKKLLLTTALSGALIGVAAAQSNPPADKPASPPAATQNQSDMKPLPTPAPKETQMAPSTSGSGSMSSSSTTTTTTSGPAANPPSTAATTSGAANPPASATMTTASPAKTDQTKIINSQRPDQFLASKFKGTDVLGANDEKIGDVSDILFDKAGQIQAYIVSVGGFLGLGSKHVALEPTAFQIVSGDKSKNEADKLKVAMTKDQLKQAADFEAYQAPRTTTGAGSSGSAPRPGNR